MAGRVEGKVALVTGGASGIGEGCAERLAEEGAKVVIGDLQDDLGKAVAERIVRNGGEAEYLNLDVASEEAWIAAIDHIRQRYGRLDILVNNAGIGAGGTAVSTPLEVWRRVMSVNLDGVFLGVKYSLPLMREAGNGGSIVNMSSIAGITAFATQSAYSTAKGGVKHFTKAVAMECAQAKDGVRVNSIHPGLIDTPIYGNGRARLDDMSQRLVPLGVKGVPLDIANGVLWLSSDEARYVTGMELVIDGGFVLR
jgi:NAD(P)-dependent dehydrogenase (short-subunit alcohol dehydrogenase family)